MPEDIVHLSAVVGSPLLDSAGERLGRIEDVVARLDGGDGLPPVIGVPLTSRMSVAGGLDALLSIAQMPPGVPVACVGVDNARNAAVLAARILGEV